MRIACPEKTRNISPGVDTGAGAEIISLAAGYIRRLTAAAPVLFGAMINDMRAI